MILEFILITAIFTITATGISGFIHRKNPPNIFVLRPTVRTENRPPPYQSTVNPTYVLDEDTYNSLVIQTKSPPSYTEKNNNSN